MNFFAFQDADHQLHGLICGDCAGKAMMIDFMLFNLLVPQHKINPEDICRVCKREALDLCFQTCRYDG